MEQGKKEYRLLLPVPMYHTDYNIWAVLKNCIGKELSKITMPVVFNEPLSFLQRMAEYMEYAHLLKIAAQQENPIDRMQYVIGFAVSALASNWERLGKPFNPLLGETYELEREDFKIICEQVSHHPPVSAFHGESDDDWCFHGSIHPKLKFWGKTVEIQPKGTLTVEFPKLKEAYTWTNVTCCVHNIIMGKMWMEQCGTMEIVCHSTGYKAHLTFKQAGGSSKDLHRVEGYITDKSKHKLIYVYGKWTEIIKCTDYHSYEEYIKENALRLKNSDHKSKSPNNSPSHTSRKMLQKFNSLKVSSLRSQSSTQEPDEADDSEEIPKDDSSFSIEIPNSTTIWKVNPRPLQTGDYYQFTEFAMSLNELEQGMQGVICPTDSRLRPDIRKLEQGDMDGAAIEKTRLEEKQRDTNKSRKSKHATQWTPRWFRQEINPYTQQEDWMYNGNYWKRQYKDVPDIF